MESITDPKLVELMNYAFVAQSTAKKPVANTESIKPASKVKGGGQPIAGLDDRLSPEEWMRRREAQLRKK